MKVHVAAIAALSLLSACASAPQVAPQEPLDRSRLPAEGPARPFAPPPIQRAALSNGLTVLFAESHELPMTGFLLAVNAGSAYDPQGKEGAASLLADVLARGTTTLDAVAVSDAFKEIGANYGTGAGLDSSFATMVTLNKHLDRALGLYADTVLHPALAAEEVERLRTQTVAAISQRKDRPEAVAGVVFNRILYGDSYYGREISGTAESVTGLTREDLVAFYDAWYHPANATLIVAGDQKLDALLPQLEKVFGAWENVPVKPPVIATPASPEKRMVYLNDRPGAPQSQLRVGTVGIARKSPDFFPSMVMNEALGGSFQSRINLNLREDKGYTYGARSMFQTAAYAGPFLVAAGVRTDATAASVDEIYKEIQAIRTDRPVTAEELTYFQEGLAQRFPSAFESTSDLLRVLSTLAVIGLPDDTYTHYVADLRAQTLESVNGATRLIDPDHIVTVVVGDRAQVEKPLQDLGFTVVLVDDQGRPIQP